VYVVGRWYGSPVERHGLRATRRILAVSGTPTPDLDAFLAAVEDVPDRGSIQILAEDLDGKREVLTLELDLRFWPTRELRFAEGGWELLKASRGDAGAARGARLSDPERMRSSWLDGRAASPGSRSAAAERSERAGR
jgi:hypothetical protein